VLSAETSFTPDATKEIVVEVSAVAASATVFEESITFDTGTATVAGAAEVVVFAALATVTASGAACAIDEMPNIARAAAVAIAIFFVVFIFSFSMLGYFPRFLPNNLGKSNNCFSILESLSLSA